MDYKFRSDCPITSSLDVLGDKWMLVIIKQMLMEGKETFKDFVESAEGIATNILSTKLKILEDLKLIHRSKLPNNKKTVLYRLTDKGLTLIPIIVELALWSDGNLRDLNPIIQDGEEMKILRKDKAAFAKMLEDQYRAKFTEDDK
jgi:DNA-binding HxlR family transcriptional regulator